MGKILVGVAGGLFLVISGGAAARAQSGGAPFNTTSPNPNPIDMPDPNAPPPSRNDVAPVPPATEPGAQAPAAVTPPAPPPAPPPAATVPAPVAAPATGPVPNVNPAPPSPPPLRKSIDNNTAAQTGAVVAPIPVQPLPPISDHGRMYVPGEAGTSKFGFAAMVGGGYEDFTHSGMRDRTTGGGTWTARVIGGVKSFVGLEAAYVGGARSVQALGQSTDSTLVSNGFEGAFRVNVPLVRNASLFEPFAFVGLGWSRYRVTNYNVGVTSDFASGDDVMTVPFGAGFAYAYKAFIADARFNYSPTYYNNLLLQGASRTGALNHWGVGGQVGFAF